MSNAFISLGDAGEQLNKISKMLGEFKDDAPKVLKSAINETAKKSSKLLVGNAQKTYTVKNAGFNKSLKLKNASVKTLTAKLESQGRPLQLSRFKTTPASPKAKAKTTKAKVYKENSAKPLEKGGIKAFVTKFASGHTAVARREEKTRYPIKVLYSMSVPKMIGNEKRVMKKMRPEILKILDEQSKIQVDKYLRKH